MHLVDGLRGPLLGEQVIQFRVQRKISEIIMASVRRCLRLEFSETERAAPRPGQVQWFCVVAVRLSAFMRKR